MKRKPSKSTDQHLGRQINFYADPRELSDWKRRAAELGMTLSAFLRAAANAFLGRTLDR